MPITQYFLFVIAPSETYNIICTLIHLGNGKSGKIKTPPINYPSLIAGAGATEHFMSLQLHSMAGHAPFVHVYATPQSANPVQPPLLPGGH